MTTQLRGPDWITKAHCPKCRGTGLVVNEQLEARPDGMIEFRAAWCDCIVVGWRPVLNIAQ